MLFDHNCDSFSQRATVWFTVGDMFIVALFHGAQIHNSFTNYMSVPCQLTLNLGSVQLCNLNKWYKAPSIEHHGSLQSHVFTLIFYFFSCTQSTLSQRCGRKSEWGNWRQRLLYVRIPTPQILIYLVFPCLPLLSCSLVLPLSVSSSLSLHNYLL